MLQLGAGALLGSHVGSAAAANGDAVSSYVGQFRHVGGDTDREARDKAIDDVVSGMNGLIRGIARTRLIDANPIAERLGLVADASSLTVTMDKLSYTGPLDGGKVKVKSITGDDMDMHYEITKESLTQVFEGDGRGRVNIFTLGTEGRLLLKVRVYAEQLPKDLIYRLGYERERRR